MSGAPDRRGRRGRDGSETRARIEVEALRLFALKSVQGTSVREIAEAVGVAEGALYRHFSSKEVLARELFLSGYAALAAQITAIAAQETDVSSRIRAVIAHACDLFDTRREEFVYLLVTQHDHLDAVPAAAEQNVVEAIGTLLREAMGRGELPEQDIALASALALGCVVQPAVFVIYGRLQGPLGGHAAAIATAVLNVLRHTAKPGVAEPRPSDPGTETPRPRVRRT